MSIEALCRGCGAEFKSGEWSDFSGGYSIFCHECRKAGVDRVTHIQNQLKEKGNLYGREAPDFVREKNLQDCYRTFLVCQDREPENEEDMADHFQTCGSCREYAQDRYRKEGRMPPLWTYYLPFQRRF